jgi:hypothetical protein
MPPRDDDAADRPDPVHDQPDRPDLADRPELADPWAEDDARWRATWHEDETAPRTTAGRLEAMGRELRQLTRESLAATLGVAAVIALLEAWDGDGFAHSKGFLLGGTLATINLWILAGGYFAIVDGRVVLPRVALAATGSLAVLLGVAIWIVFTQPAWALGFGLGLAVPALGGIIHAVRSDS